MGQKVNFDLFCKGNPPHPNFQALVLILSGSSTLREVQETV